MFKAVNYFEKNPFEFELPLNYSPLIVCEYKGNCSLLLDENNSFSNYLKAEFLLWLAVRSFHF